MDKSEELNVFGGAPTRLEVIREGEDSVRALILRSNFIISTGAACLIGS